MPSNDQIILPSRRGVSRLTIARHERRTLVEIDGGDAGDGAEGSVVTLDQSELARLRTWLNTGVVPSRFDLCDPVPPTAATDMRGLDPMPVDFRSDGHAQTLTALREQFCDCPGHGLDASQHSPDGCHGLEVAAAAARWLTRPSTPIEDQGRDGE